jgi:hypothetical protein
MSSLPNIDAWKRPEPRRWDSGLSETASQKAIFKGGVDSVRGQAPGFGTRG